MSAELIDRVLDRVDAKRSGDGWLARCPAHDDHTPSLGIDVGDDGTVLLHCRAGCSFDKIVAELGLKASDLFPPRQRTKSSRTVATYRYVDEQHDMLFETVRKDPKGFYQRRPNGRGGYINELGDVRRVIYRLPHVIAAVDAGQLVYVCEGEKDAEALVAIGCCATTSPLGAGKWSKVAEHAEQVLAGAHVRIIADCDDAGRRHARDVAASLKRVAASVTVIEAAGLFNDAAEHLGAGRSVDELTVIASNCSTRHADDVRSLDDWLDDVRVDAASTNSDDTSSTNDDSTTASVDRFRRWSIGELLALDLTFLWDVVGLLVRPTYGVDTGELKTLKTYWAIARAVALAAGVPVLGHWQVPERRRVLCYVAEGGQIPYTRRLQRMCDAYGIDPSDLEGWLETIFGAGPLDSKPFRDSLRGHLDDFRPALVHLDPLYPFQPMSVDSNKLSQVGLMLNEVQAICAERDVTFWITAHMNQTGSGFDLKRITGAGVGEWGDSWMLLKHRSTPDVEQGRFRLTADIGSRQWGGTSVDIDFDLGRFDTLLGMHDGPLKFKVRSATQSEPIDVDSVKRSDARLAVLATMRKARHPLTRTEIRIRTTGASKAHIDAELSMLIDDGALVQHSVRRPANGGHEAALYVLAERWRDG